MAPRNSPGGGEMNLEEIEKRWAKYKLDTWDKRDIERLISRVKELEADLRLNTSMLARQCDLARDAETRAEKAEASKKKLMEEIKKHRCSLRADYYDDYVGCHADKELYKALEEGEK